MSDVDASLIDQYRMSIDEARDVGGESISFAVDDLEELLDAMAQLAAARDQVHFCCDCVPHLGPPHCHRCHTERGKETPWTQCITVADERERAVAEVVEPIRALAYGWFPPLARPAVGYEAVRQSCARQLRAALPAQPADQAQETDR